MSTQTNAGGKVSAETSSSAEDLVFGDDPQSSFAIPKSLMTQLWESVSEGTRDPSQKGGLEVGGLLVGPKAAGGKVVVDTIIPLPIEYRFGSLYQMSVFDLPNIAPAIRAVHDDPATTVVGFYRSRICDDKTLRPSDREVFQAVEATHPFFADFRCCFILAPAGESEAQACVVMRSGTNWNETPAFSLRRDPLAILPPSPSTVLQQLARNMRTVEQSSKAPAASSPATPPVAESPLAQPVPQNTVAAEAPIAKSVETKAVEEKGSGVQRARVWVYAAVGVLAVVVAIFYFSGGKTPPPPPAPVQAVTPRFGFSATFESPVWRLSWNRAAMEDLKPVGAVLSIQDGAVQQELPLAAADLASGTIFYTPQFGDLNFGLKVDLGGSFAEEHVRVLGAPDLAQKPGQKSAVAQPSVQTGIISSVAPPPAVPPTTGQPVNNQANKQIPVAADSAVVPPVAPPPPSKPEPRVFSPVIAQSKETAKAAAPEIISAAPPPVQPTALAFAMPVAPTFELPRPAAPQNTPPAPGAVPTTGAVPGATAPASNASTQAAKSDYVGPRPIKQVSLEMPVNMSSGVSQVQVTVEIDVTGKVTKVNPVGWTSSNAALMVRAVRAASDWRFDPARSGGRPVPSQMILTFRLDGQQRR